MVLLDRIRDNFKGTKEAVLRLIAGESVEVSAGKYRNTMEGFRSKDDILTCLIHLGYLACDLESKTCHIPNREVRKAWILSLEDEERKTPRARIECP